MLSRNQQYLLHKWSESGATTGLDYGCGDGDLVAELASKGDDFWGTDSYYDSEDFEAASRVRIPKVAESRIRRLGDNNSIPWPDETFDWICSGQVIEHVEHLDRAVDELARVTKLGGVNVHTFPTREALVEQHLRVPLYHRLSPEWRKAVAHVCFQIGIAERFDFTDFQTWFEDKNNFFEQSVYLRRYAVVCASFARYFDVRDISIDKLSYHLHVTVPDSALTRGLERLRHGVTLSMTLQRKPVGHMR